MIVKQASKIWLFMQWFKFVRILSKFTMFSRENKQCVSFSSLCVIQRIRIKDLLKEQLAWSSLQFSKMFWIILEQT